MGQTVTFNTSSIVYPLVGDSNNVPFSGRLRFVTSENQNEVARSITPHDIVFLSDNIEEWPFWGSAGILVVNSGASHQISRFAWLNITFAVLDTSQTHPQALQVHDGCHIIVTKRGIEIESASRNIYSIDQQIINLSRRLQKLREIQALKGIDTEPHYLIEIEDVEEKLEELQKQRKNMVNLQTPNFR